MIGGALAITAAAMAQDAAFDDGVVRITPKPPATAPRLDVVQDAHDTKASSRSAPVLDAITARYYVRNTQGVVLDIVPDFHFHAPNGNAIVLHRELVATNGAIGQTQITNATINIPSDGQKNGAVISGGWRCGVPVYYVTMRTVILDADGNRSNTLTYTIHCNGG
jgi:hypothetical protein